MVALSTAWSAQLLSRPSDSVAALTGDSAAVDRLSLLRTPRLPPPRNLVNPALVEQARERSKSLENRFADRITAFSGSMTFVYLHALWFTLWIGLGIERYPYGLLTMIVSLEAIFLSTFVMISQNRADAKREALANQAWQTVQERTSERGAPSALPPDPRSDAATAPAERPRRELTIRTHSSQ